MKVRCVEDPQFYRHIHYPNMWDTVFDYSPEHSPLAKFMASLNKAPAPPEYVRWMEECDHSGSK